MALIITIGLACALRVSVQDQDSNNIDFREEENSHNFLDNFSDQGPVQREG